MQVATQRSSGPALRAIGSRTASPATLHSRPGLVKGAWKGVDSASATRAMNQAVPQDLLLKSDEELVQLFQSGSARESAFMTLFERHGPITYGFLRRRIGHSDLAAELNQELYLGVLEGLDRFRGESSFKTWLFRLAHNHLSNLRRRFRTHLDERADSIPEELMEGLQDAAAELPETSVVKEEQCRLLTLCLARLPEIERAVVIGQYYEDVTLEELTSRFKLTNRSGARASLIAAQRKLRRCMEQAGIGGNGARARAKGRA